MTSRERVIRTLEFDRPDRVPRDLWALAGVTMLRRDEYDAVQAKYPGDFAGQDCRYGDSGRRRGSGAEVGTYTDDWGCEFTVAQPGVCGEVKNPPLADWAALEDWTPPWELLDGADFGPVNASCAATDKFVKAGTHVRPFERMQFLRGSENLFMDLATQPPEFFRLRDEIHAFGIRDMELWAKTDVDAVGFMDDWGAQQGLLIAPPLWRELFKPMYKDYCDILKSAGKYVFFHSDGHTAAIIADLIEVGVDALNAQCFAWTSKTWRGGTKAGSRSGARFAASTSSPSAPSTTSAPPSAASAMPSTTPPAASSPNASGASTTPKRTSRPSSRRGWNNVRRSK